MSDRIYFNDRKAQSRGAPTPGRSVGVRIQIIVPPSDLDQIDIAALNLGMSRSAYMVACATGRTIPLAAAPISRTEKYPLLVGSHSASNDLDRKADIARNAAKSKRAR